MIRIVADTTCDYPQELHIEEKITIIPLKVTINGMNYDDKLELSNQQFFELLPQSEQLPVTAAPSPEQYRRVFETFCANGDSVLCFTCSSKLSASYQSALIAKDMVEGKIDIIDTRTAALGSGMPVMDALEMIQAGKTHEEIAAACRSRVSRLSTLILLDTVEYLKRGGRISPLAARMAGVLNIKPIIHVMKDGSNEVLHKARSLQKGMQWIRDYVMENCGRPLSEQSIGIGYSSDIRPAQRFIALLQAKVKPKRIDIADIGCVVGTHIGPGAFGIFWEDVR